MQHGRNSLCERHDCRADALPAQLLAAREPLVLRGLVAHWPVVLAAQQSARAAADYIGQFDQGKVATAYIAPAQTGGRVFYSDDLTGFNFERSRLTLTDAMTAVLDGQGHTDAPVVYVGSTVIDHWLPGFRGDNDVDLDGREHLASIWLGGKSRIAAHFDVPQNIACAVAGRRRFTLFPPDQARNLYVGPLDFTPSGQPISLVDATQPDLERFPRYADAMAASYQVDLAPGDALLIPSMWWHHVESLEPFNVLVNYWWRATPAFQGSPMNALHHAIMSVRELPAEQRRAWRELFDYYVFDREDDAFEHIPAAARGVLEHVDEASASALKAQLVRFLK